MTATLSAPKSGIIYARQIAFVAAFILPMGKLLDLPSLLAQWAKGDILVPSVMQFLTQSLVLLALLYAASQSEKSLLQRLTETFGKGVKVFFILYALYFLLATALPLLDVEKFVYAAFFDAAPTTFSFGLFFILLAYVCVKGLRCLGRCADFFLFLFPVSFLALAIMALFETDFTNLLPLFGTDFHGVSKAFVYSSPHFSDVGLLLPLIVVTPYKKGDGAKITLGYFAGAVTTLLFLAIFFGVFSSISPREHYAFAKIAQYFPALDVIGRIDLIFIYLLSVVLLVYVSLPVLYVSELSSHIFHTEKKLIFSTILSIGLFVFVLFFNRHHDLFYRVICRRLYPVFWIFSYILPILLLPLPKKEKRYV